MRPAIIAWCTLIASYSRARWGRSAGPTGGSKQPGGLKERHRHGHRRTIRYQHRHPTGIRSWHFANTRISASGRDLRMPRHRMSDVGKRIGRRSGCHNWHSPPWRAGCYRLCPRGDLCCALGRTRRVRRQRRKPAISCVSPAWLPHMEINPSSTKSFRRIVVRSTPTPIVVNLPDDYWQAPR